MQPNAPRSTSGFTLLETIVATSLLVTVLAGLAQLVVLSTRFARNSGRRGDAVMAAQAKIEDLRARRYGYDAAGDPITDPVLAPSPPDTLVGDVEGYSESLGGIFSRRWAITPFDRLAPDALVIEVCVFREPADDVPLAAAEACVSTIRARQP